MLSENIKEATKQAHQQLEKKVVQKLKAIRNNEDYADLLGYFYAYFNRLEKAIKPFITADLLPDLHERRNSSYLKNDIQELVGDNVDLPSATITSIDNRLQAFGALYVMEGSVMGGGIIVQMLAKAGVTKGVSFFSGYGPATGQKWGAFIAVLNQLAHNSEHEQVVIEAANQTFEHFARMFTEVAALR